MTTLPQSGNILIDSDRPVGEWFDALERANQNYQAARYRHAETTVRRLGLVRKQKTLKREIIKGLRASGMAATPANKEYVDDPRWEVALDEVEAIDIELVELDCARAIATHNREIVLAAFERATVERKINAPLVVQPDGSFFQTGSQKG